MLGIRERKVVTIMKLYLHREATQKEVGGRMEKGNKER
jgi:hypothetical protein